MEDIYIATLLSINQIGQPAAAEETIMIDSGAATHVCEPWFGTSFPLHQMKQQDKPILRTVTGTGFMATDDVKQPILSVTGLMHQGFEINMSESSTMTHPKSFESHITQKDGLLYINLKLSPLPLGQQLIIKNEEGGIQRAMIAPTQLDTSGPRPRSGSSDIWTMNSQGYIVRIH